MNQYLYKSLFHPIYHNILKRDSFYKLDEFYNRTQYWSPDRLRSLQCEKIINLLRFAYDNNHYYNKLFNNHHIRDFDINSIDDLVKIPFLTKDIIRNNYASLKSRNIRSNRVIPNSTSGSTGKSLQFLSDANANIHRAVLDARMNKWAGLEIGFKKLSIWGARFDIRKEQYLLSQLKQFVKNSKILSGYNLSEKDLGSYFQILSNFKPNLITGYPSSLEIFSTFLINNNQKYVPQAIRTEGETLHESQKKQIEFAFNAPVYNYYSSREISGLAHECNMHNGLHILSENVLLEVIDDYGNPIDSGEGEIVITDLHNYVMPFIRYKIGDRAVISNRICKCGLQLPLITKIIGRTFDIIRFPNGNSVSGTFWTLLLKTFPGIDNFQVEQIQLDLIILRLVINQTFNSTFEKYISNKIKEYGGEDITIKVVFTNKIPTNEGGKAKYIISKLKD